MDYAEDDHAVHPGYPSEEEYARPIVKGFISGWMRALTAQAERIFSPGTGTTETLLFIMSLRQLLRGVELAIAHAEHFDDPRRAALHRKALDEFDLAVPNAKDVRDIIEHFDEYQLGRGRLQRSGTAPPEPLALYPEGHGEQYRIHLLDGYELAIEPTLAAAQKLADRTLAVLSDS